MAKRLLEINHTSWLLMQSRMATLVAKKEERLEAFEQKYGKNSAAYTALNNEIQDILDVTNFADEYISILRVEFAEYRMQTINTNIAHAEMMEFFKAEILGNNNFSQQLLDTFKNNGNNQKTEGHSEPVPTGKGEKGKDDL